MLTLTDSQLAELGPILTPRLPSPYTDAYRAGITVKQQAAGILHHIPNIMYGGAAGGAKTWWLLAEALAYCDIPGYAALLIRDTWPNLSREPDGLIPIAHKWLRGTPAAWDGENRTWRFPAGATLSFGHLQTPEAHHNFDGPSYQMVGFDEVTHIRPGQFEHLQTRLRRLTSLQVPVRIRTASNPGGRYHSYYRHYYALDGTQPVPGRLYIPSRVVDNPHLDAADYIARLSSLPDVLRLRILEGDWSVDDSGGFFRPENIAVVDDWPRHARTVRGWDFASTDSSVGGDPDWTAGCRVGVADGVCYIVDMVRGRWDPAGVETAVRTAAAQDGPSTEIVIEEEAGAAGRNLVHTYRRMLTGHRVHAGSVSGSKLVRATPFATAVGKGQVVLVRGRWNEEFLTELSGFGAAGSRHDDQVDAAAHAFNRVARYLDDSGSRVRFPNT